MEQLVSRRAQMLTWEETTVSGEPGTTGAYAHYQIIRRNGSVVPFEPNKIAHAMMKAFMAVHGAWAFAQSICSGWLHGFWRPLKPSRVSAHAGDRAACLDRPIHVAPQRDQSRHLRFFGSSKLDMRNAP
jgi:hypothetical protein